MRNSTSRLPSRRASVLVLAALFIIVFLTIVACAIDVGYMLLVRTELQSAADSSALAAAADLANPQEAVLSAKRYSELHTAGSRKAPVKLNNDDVEFGVWDATTRTFTPMPDQSGNAVRVTTRRNSETGANRLFFAGLLGRGTFDISASAVAMGNPRDICFVVDLSGSMNNDTEPGYTGSGTITGSYAAVRTQMLEDVYDDFGFGGYPGTQQAVGQPLAVTNLSSLSSSSGPLSKLTWTIDGVTSSIPSIYKITSSDSSSTRKTKAYRFITDYQIASIMPNAKPAANSGSSGSFAYWSKYLDVVTSQSSSNQFVGYRTYVQFMMDKGREGRPDGTNYTPLSIDSPDCPWHAEDVGEDSFQFPPREQPTHACRRSLIAAIQEIRKRNSSVADEDLRDWVSIVTFDTVAGTRVAYPLSGDYEAAMLACTTMQAVGDSYSSTATETGLIFARNHIKAKTQGGMGRSHTQKVVVLLTDGMPNLKSSSNTTINTYIKDNPNDNFYGSKSNHDAAIMQAAIMYAEHWKTFGVALGLGADYDFMDRLVRMGNTADDDGQAPRTSGDPADYEVELRSIFKQIVDTPDVRLVN
jgi:hypothetical protein